MKTPMQGTRKKPETPISRSQEYTHFSHCHTCILRQGTVPSSLDRVDIKSLLRQLRRILGESYSRARLEQREGQHSPEHPRQLEDLLELEFLVSLG